MTTNTPQEDFIARADAVARETGWNVEDWATDNDWRAVGIGPVGRHRDSSARERSNFDVVYADLRETFGDAVSSASFGHWGVGWVEEITFDASRDDVCDAVERWEVALADYPVADDSHCSALEHEEACETIRAILPGSLRQDDGSYLELRDDLPDDWAEEVFSHMYEDGCATDPESMRGADIEAAAIALGFYVLEPTDD